MEEEKSNNNIDQMGASAGKETLPNSRLMAALAYLGPLIIISYLIAKDNRFVKFHIRQGLVLIAIMVILWFFSRLVWFLWPLTQIVNLVVLILAIIGITNAVQDKEKELPVVGKMARVFNF